MAELVDEQRGRAADRPNQRSHRDRHASPRPERGEPHRQEQYRSEAAGPKLTSAGSRRPCRFPSASIVPFSQRRSRRNVTRHDRPLEGLAARDDDAAQ
jgi:hypothetical protein